jgi:multidrug efflux system membrane fusion protein
MAPRISGSLALLAGATLAGLVGCKDAEPGTTELPPPAVTVSKVVVRTITPQDEYEGRIGAAEKVEVRARVRGHLMKVNFEAGQMVKKGQLLYEIDVRPYKASLDAAEAAVKAAEANFTLATAELKREESLAQQRATSAREVDVWAGKQAVAKGEVLKAKANTEQAKLDVDFTRIESPIDGKVSRTQVDVGNLVNAGGGDTLLTVITSVDPTYVYFNVDERSLTRYRHTYSKGQKDTPTVKELKIPVLVALEGEEDYPHKGIIDFVDNRINPGTGTVQARGLLDSEKNVFDDGMRARVRIPAGAAQEVLLVTDRALGSDQGRKYVFVVNAQNKAERRDVTAGRLADGMRVIEAGLQPGERVVVNGIQRVREGAEVAARDVPMPGAK